MSNALRVLHVGKYYPPFAGGIENFHADLAREQSRQGLWVTSLVHQHELGQPSQQEIDDNTTVHRARLWGRWLYTPVCLGFRQMLARILREFKPDVLHFHLPNPSAKLALTIGAARRIPWVVQWQSDIVASACDRRLAWAYRCYAPLERRFLAQAAAIIAASPPYLESSEPLRRWHERCYVVPLGIDRCRLPDPTPAGLAWADDQWQPNMLRVLDIGRLTYYKGHEYLIRAAARTPNVQVCLIGSGDLHRRLDSMIRGLGLENRVKLQGYLHDDQVRGFLATCDCLCLPSIERTEAFGLVMVEAMRYGKPVVAGKIPGSGVGWVVEHRRTGLLVSPADEAALASALDSLHHDPALRQRLGIAASDAFFRRFDITPVASAILDIYHNAIAANQKMVT